MLEKKTKNENTYTNVAFSHTPETSGWKEIPRTSIETSHETLIPGEFGITVVQGTFLCPLEKTKGACSVKMLKGKIKYSILIFIKWLEQSRIVQNLIASTSQLSLVLKDS